MIVRLPPLPWMVVDPRERIQVALVRWDPQTWKGDAGTVTLDTFEASIHAEYLDVKKQ